MPDFFEGEPADHSWYPPDNKEKGEKLGQFFKTKAAADKNVPRISKVVKEITEKSGGTIKNWGAIGMCWGGKVGRFSSSAIGNSCTCTNSWKSRLIDVL